MRTASNVATAKTIATEVGIDESPGNLLPEDKLTEIKALQPPWRHRHDRRRHQ